MVASRGTKTDGDVGRPIDVLDTPCLTVDLDLTERNVARMADVAAAHNVDLRPHVKTHKTPALAHLQLAAGAVGITVAKLGEAEVFADAGCDDVLVAYQIVGRGKIARLLRLSEVATVRSCVDGLEAAAALSDMSRASGATFQVLLDVDTGLKRTGCSPADAIRLGSRSDDLPGVSVVGVFSYAGYRPADPDAAVRRAWALQEAETAADVARHLHLR